MLKKMLLHLIKQIRIAKLIIKLLTLLSYYSLKQNPNNYI